LAYLMDVFVLVHSVITLLCSLNTLIEQCLLHSE
jgi:hypothetical protein